MKITRRLQKAPRFSEVIVLPENLPIEEALHGLAIAYWRDENKSIESIHLTAEAYACLLLAMSNKQFTDNGVRLLFHTVGHPIHISPSVNPELDQYNVCFV